MFFDLPVELQFEILFYIQYPWDVLSLKLVSKQCKELIEIIFDHSYFNNLPLKYNLRLGNVKELTRLITSYPKIRVSLNTVMGGCIHVTGHGISLQSALFLINGDYLLPHSKWHLLRYSCENNYIEPVRLLLLDTSPDDSSTNINIALRKGYLEIAKLLIGDERGQKMVAEEDTLACIVKNNYFELFKLLVENQLVPNTSLNYDMEQFQWDHTQTRKHWGIMGEPLAKFVTKSFQNGHLEMVKSLISFYNLDPFEFGSLEFIVSSYKHTSIIRLLVNLDKQKGTHFIRTIAFASGIKEFQDLVSLEDNRQHTMDISTLSSKDQYRVLEIAYMYNQCDLVESMLDLLVVSFDKTKQLLTSFKSGIDNSRAAVVLMKRYHIVASVDLLKWAFAVGNTVLVELLLSQDSTLVILGYPIPIDESNRVNCNTAQMLLESGNILVTCSEKQDLLLLACLSGYTSLVKYFLQDPGVDPGRNNNGCLRETCINGTCDKDVIAMLLSDSRVHVSGDDPEIQKCVLGLIDRFAMYHTNSWGRKHEDIKQALALFLMDKRVVLTVDTKKWVMQWIIKHDEIDIFKTIINSNDLQQYKNIMMELSWVLGAKKIFKFIKITT